MLPEDADGFFKHFGLRQIEFTSKRKGKANSNVKELKA
jgi:hypothetical protein